MLDLVLRKNLRDVQGNRTMIEANELRVFRASLPCRVPRIPDTVISTLGLLFRLLGLATAQLGLDTCLEFVNFPWNVVMRSKKAVRLTDVHLP
jgi:hypothetical protein